jgi:WD40 repeat protein
MKLWELDTGALIRSFDGHLRGLACLKLVELSRQIITGSNDETIKIWNLLNGQCLQTLLAHSGLVRSLDFSLPHNRLVSGSSVIPPFFLLSLSLPPFFNSDDPFLFFFFFLYTTLL